MDDTASRGVIEYQVACLFNIVYKQLATIPNAESGFKVSGIYPFNDNLFNGSDFAPASVTDQMLKATMAQLQNCIRIPP